MKDNTAMDVKTMLTNRQRRTNIPYILQWSCIGTRQSSHQGPIIQ